MEKPDELDHLYYRNLIRGIKLAIATKGLLNKKRTSQSTKQN
nr:MAG TPA: hypothetical protein [Caudoviricetes sp.]